MEINILKDDKNELDVQVDNLTVVELLRNYLNKDSSVKMAAWRREHPTKPLILNIKTQGKSPKKALQDDISGIEKDSMKLISEFKKGKN